MDIKLTMDVNVSSITSLYSTCIYIHTCSKNQYGVYLSLYESSSNHIVVLFVSVCIFHKLYCYSICLCMLLYKAYHGSICLHINLPQTYSRVHMFLYTSYTNNIMGLFASINKQDHFSIQMGYWTQDSMNLKSSCVNTICGH